MRSFRLIEETAPLFELPLPVGQLYFPEWHRYEAAMRDIFNRQYYNNNGPLVTELEARLRDFLGVKHVLCVGNATFGLMMVADALRLTGRVLIPSFTFIATAQSLAWCGLSPAFCDVSSETHQLSLEAVSASLADDRGISAILAVNLWGGACEIHELDAVSKEHKVPLYFDSAHSFGCKYGDQLIGGFGCAEVFSFHATKVLSAGEGGCVTTNDDDLAAKLRGIRPSYDAGNTVEPYRVLNSRMSEAQAAIALMSLEHYPLIQARNKMLFDAYSRNLAGVPGIRLQHPSNVTASNYQYAACTLDTEDFGLTRDQLLRLLQAENVMARRYFYPGTHRCAGFDDNAKAEAARLPVTERLCATSIQLPLGARVNLSDVDKICELIAQAQAAAPTISRLMKSNGLCDLA